MLEKSNKKWLGKFYFYLFLPLLAYILAYILIKYNGTSICLWKNIFHTDCWGCGITRAFFAFCHLDFKSALDYNAKIFIIIPLFIYVWLSELYKIYKNKH